MPEWPAQNKYIGQPTTRVDAAPKLTGRARYSSDVQANGWLYGMILRSKWPAAKILSVNFDKAEPPRRQSSGPGAGDSVHRAVLWRGDRRRGGHEQTGVP